MCRKNNVVWIFTDAKDVDLIKSSIRVIDDITDLNVYIDDNTGKALIAFISKTSMRKVAKIIKKRIYKSKIKIKNGIIFVDVDMA